MCVDTVEVVVAAVVAVPLPNQVGICYVTTDSDFLSLGRREREEFELQPTRKQRKKA